MNKNIYTKEIIINNKPLIVTNAVEYYISKHPKSAGYLLLSGAFPRNVRLAIKHLDQLTSQGAIIHDISDEALDQLLSEEFEEITACGGLVINAEHELLMIFRRGFWDLPKGKMDDGETEDETAVREVIEETGLNTVRIEKLLDTTYHYYMQDDRKVLKKTIWYKMTTPDVPQLTPQVEEDIMMAKWVNKTEARLLVKSTYTIVQNLVNKYF